MRVAYFTEAFLPKCDGVVNTLCYLLDYLAACGHSSLLFAPEGAPEEYAETPVVGLPSVPFPLYPELRLVPLEIVATAATLLAGDPNVIGAVPMDTEEVAVIPGLVFRVGICFDVVSYNLG